MPHSPLLANQNPAYYPTSMKASVNPPPTRRDFLQITTGAVAGAGALAVAWPLVNQMNPNPGTADTLDINLAELAEGEEMTFPWRDGVWVVRHRTPDEIASVRSVPPAEIYDPLGRNSDLFKALPATDESRACPFDQRFIVMSRLCPRYRIPLQHSEHGLWTFRSPHDWWCIECASRFDASGRVYYGPAGENLPIPRYSRVSGTTIRIGSEVQQW